MFNAVKHLGIACLLLKRSGLYSSRVRKTILFVTVAPTAP
jgi:hypothetical protein